MQSMHKSNVQYDPDWKLAPAFEEQKFCLNETPKFLDGTTKYLFI